MSNQQAPNTTRSAPSFLGSAAPLYIALAESLQNKILSGEFPPGSPLPPVIELAQTYRVAGMTARQAVALLEKRGFVIRRHGKRTFVQEGAGKLLIGLVVGPSLSEEATHYYRAIVRALKEACDKAGWMSRTYDGFLDNCGAKVPMDQSVVKQFRMDLKSQIFHGLVEISPGAQGLEEIEEGFPLPKVKYEPPAEDTDLSFDHYNFGKTAVHFLAGKGIRDIAYIRQNFRPLAEKSSERSLDMDGVFDAARELNLPIPEIKNIQNFHAAPGMLRESDQLVFDHAVAFFRNWKRKGSKLGLIVNDDIAMRAIALAMKQEQVEVPEQCEIVCMANDQVKLHYGYAINRYEWPITTLASQALEILRARIFSEISPKIPSIIPGRLIAASMTEKLSGVPASTFESVSQPLSS